MLVVIGCGNLNRSDDAVGARVVHRLRDHYGTALPKDVRLFDAGTDGMEVMFQARGARRLVIVDASRSGSPAGSVFEVPGEELARDHAPAFTLHDFRWEHALAAGRRIFREEFPTDVRVLLIEAQDLGLGLELSAPAQAAADGVVAQLVQLIDAHHAA
jgi:hydrogenase maturation protease